MSTSSKTTVFTFSSWARFLSAVWILVAIFGSELGKIYFQVLFKAYSNNTMMLDNVWLASQLVGATLLGFISDRFYKVPLRKPSIIFGATLFFVTIFLLWVGFLKSIFLITLCVIVNGLFGSYLGVARAFFFDQSHKKQLHYFAVTVFFQVLAWAIFGYFLKSGQLTYSQIGTCLIYLLPCILIGLLFTKNQRVESDLSESKHGAIEISNVRHRFFNKFFLCMILLFFITDFLYETMPYFAEFKLPVYQMNLEYFLLGIGALIGAIISFVPRTHRTLNWLRGLYLILAVVFLIYFLRNHNFAIAKRFAPIQFLIIAVFLTLAWVLVVKEFIVKTTFNEDGLILGFLESLSSFAEISASFLLSIQLTRQIVARNLFFSAFLIVAFILAYIAIKIKKSQHR